MSGDALREAYGAAANSPAELLRLVFSGCEPRPDGEGGGGMRDPRPGATDKDPSFTFWRGKEDGGAMFARKGSGESWNALTLLEQYGNGGAGMTRKEAAALLISRAGLEGRDAEGRKELPRAAQAAAAAPRPGVTLRERQAREQYAEEPRKVLRGWELLTADTGAASPAWEELRRRGLLSALGAGLLEAYHLPPSGSPRRIPYRVLPGALALLIKGADGVPLAVKFRNPGSKAELSAAEVTRYAYPKGHKGTPAHFPRPLPEPLPSAFLWIEGELNGVAAALSLEAVGNPLGLYVQGIAGAGCFPSVPADLTGRRVYVYADPDAEGEHAREKWAAVAADLGAEVFQVPPLSDTDPGKDAADLLGELAETHGEKEAAEILGAALMARLEQAPRWQLPAPEQNAEAEAWGEGFEVRPYRIEGGEVVKMIPDKETPGEFRPRPLLGFTARIVAEELRELGDGEPLKLFRIEGRTADGVPLPTIEVPAGKFGAMNWPLEHWGTDGDVYPGAAVKADAAAAVLRLSKRAGLIKRTVYGHTGWIQHAEYGPVFLTAGACIGAAGAVPGVSVSLLGKLAAYNLPEPPEGNAEAEAVREVLELLTLGDDIRIMFALLGAAFRAPLGAVRFSVWFEGKTGWGKSSAARIVQTLYGAAWLEQFPPADMSSTDNALTLNTFLARDVFFTADDFKPEGTRADVDKAHGSLSKFLSAAGNGAGRDRMDFQNMRVRSGYYPRGLVVLTAETSPRKHSDIARTVSLVPQTAFIGPDAPADWRARFGHAERRAAEGVYASALAGFLRWIAGDFRALTGAALLERVRQSAEQFPGAHGRTSQNSAELFEGWRAFLTYARDCGAITEAEGRQLGEQARDAFRETSAEQGTALGTADPVSRFLTLLSSLLRSGAVYVRDADTGEAPGGEMGPDNEYAPALGWRWRRTGETEAGDMLGVWEPARNAVPIGYLGNYQGRVLLLLEQGAYAEVNKAAEREGYALPAPRALWRLMGDRFRVGGGMVTEKDRATYPRKVYGCAPGERVALYNLSWPLPSIRGEGEQERDERDAEGKNAIGSGFSHVPFNFLETGHNKKKRDITPETLSSTSFSGVPFLPSAETLEQRGESSADPLPDDAPEVFEV